MSAKNIDMSKIKQVMRMMLQVNARGRHPSNRKIAETVGLYKGTVNDYVKRIEADGLGIEALLKLDDPVLERRLCPGSAAYSDERFAYMTERMDYYLEELKRPHMTLQLLCEEYRAAVTNPYSYSQFCFHIAQHTKASTPPTAVLTEHRQGGREMMVDFAGDKLHIIWRKRKSREEETRQILEENRALRAELVKLGQQLGGREESEKRYREDMAKKDAEMRELMHRILSLQKELGNAMAAVRLGRGKRFAPSSEKMSLTGKDRSDRRVDEKDDFDGTPPAGGSSTPADAGNDSSPKPEPPKRKKKRSEGRKTSLEDYGCDEVVRHELDDYFSLPEEAVFKTRNGQVETHEYVSYEFIRAVW